MFTDAPHHLKFLHKQQNHLALVDVSNYFSVLDRPKRLLVLLNPASGKFRGREIYEKIVTPLFQMADIQTDVISKSPTIEIVALLSFCHLSRILFLF